MGLYTLNCIACKEPFLWHSGNVTDQVCSNCRVPKEENIMTIEQQLIESLNTTIKSQADLIEHLKKEIQRLNTIPTYIGPAGPLEPVSPSTQPIGIPPWYNPQMIPAYPGSPTTPWVNPLQPPYIVTCGAQGVSQHPDLKTTIGDCPSGIGQGQSTSDPNLKFTIQNGVTNFHNPTAGEINPFSLNSTDINNLKNVTLTSSEPMTYNQCVS